MLGVVSLLYKWREEAQEDKGVGVSSPTPKPCMLAQGAECGSVKPAASTQSSIRQPAVPWDHQSGCLKGEVSLSDIAFHFYFA